MLVVINRRGKVEGDTWGDGGTGHRSSEKGPAGGLHGHVVCQEEVTSLSVRGHLGWGGEPGL